MVTGAVTVDTGIIKTSSLFQDKQSGAWHGPGGELMGRDFIQLANCGSGAVIGPKNTVMGALFIGVGCQNDIPVMIFTVSSHCAYHLPEIWG